MMNASFFIYLFGSCIGIAIVALLLLIFKVHTEKAMWKNILMLFVITTFLLGVLYFGERYYTNDFETKGGWSIGIRVLDLFLASAQFFLWCWFLRAKAFIRERRIIWGTNGVLIGIFVIQAVIYVFLMDEHYYIASDSARITATVLAILCMLLLAVVLVGHMFIITKRIPDKRSQAYLSGISLLLLFDLLWESFYVLMLFWSHPILEKLYVSFDLISLIFLLINLLMALYIYRCEIDRMMPVTVEQHEQQQQAVRLEALQAGGLSEREIEVGMLLLDGNSYDDIAEKLHISKYTVKRHAHNLYQKLEVANKGELINRFR